MVVWIVHIDPLGRPRLCDEQVDARRFGTHEDDRARRPSDETCMRRRAFAHDDGHVHGVDASPHVADDEMGSQLRHEHQHLGLAALKGYGDPVGDAGTVGPSQGRAETQAHVRRIQVTRGVEGVPRRAMILVLTDDTAAAAAQGWLARGRSEGLNVEVRSARIPSDVAERVRVAQGRQRMVNETGERDP
jgi:hypothetical protein